jgi:hypothetical protein
MSDDLRTPHPKALPNYQKAEIPPDKLTKYALNPTHTTQVWGKSSGKDKARVFKSALGFEQADWMIFKERILAELPYHEATLGHEDEHGRRYNVTLPITGLNGNTANVLTAWIILKGMDTPTLTTTFCV